MSTIGMYKRMVHKLVGARKRAIGARGEHHRSGSEKRWKKHLDEMDRFLVDLERFYEKEYPE